MLYFSSFFSSFFSSLKLFALDSVQEHREIRIIWVGYCSWVIFTESAHSLQVTISLCVLLCVSSVSKMSKLRTPFFGKVWPFGGFNLIWNFCFFALWSSLLCIVGAAGVGDMWQVTCDMWHLTHDTWHVVLLINLIFVWIWFFFGIGASIHQEIQCLPYALYLTLICVVKKRFHWIGP